MQPQMVLPGEVHPVLVLRLIIGRIAVVEGVGAVIEFDGMAAVPIGDGHALQPLGGGLHQLQRAAEIYLVDTKAVAGAAVAVADHLEIGGGPADVPEPSPPHEDLPHLLVLLRRKDAAGCPQFILSEVRDGLAPFQHIPQHGILRFRLDGEDLQLLRQCQQAVPHTEEKIGQLRVEIVVHIQPVCFGG